MTSPVFASALQPECGREVRPEQQEKAEPRSRGGKNNGDARRKVDADEGVLCVSANNPSGIRIMFHSTVAENTLESDFDSN